MVELQNISKEIANHANKDAFILEGSITDEENIKKSLKIFQSLLPEAKKVLFREFTYKDTVITVSDQIEFMDIMSQMEDGENSKSINMISQRICANSLA